jgi:hypothetical protein
MRKNRRATEQTALIRRYSRAERQARNIGHKHRDPAALAQAATYRTLRRELTAVPDDV